MRAAIAGLALSGAGSSLVFAPTASIVLIGALFAAYIITLVVEIKHPGVFARIAAPIRGKGGGP
jgi:hypothetical protein